jgi:hypothetical protein
MALRIRSAYHATPLYPQKLALTSPRSGGRSVGIVRCYQILWVVGLERGPLSLVSTIEELLERKSSSSSLENRDYVLGIRSADHATPVYLLKLALTSRQAAVARSVSFARGIRPQTLFCSLLFWRTWSISQFKIKLNKRRSFEVLTQITIANTSI